MKNMVYCFICNLLLIALIILTSCGRQSEAVEVVPAPIPMEQEEGGVAIDERIRFAPPVWRVTVEKIDK